MGLDTKWRAAAWTAGLVGAGVALVMMARTEELDAPISVLLACDVLLGLALFAGPGALDPRFFVVRIRGVVRPGLAAVTAQAVVGCLVFPLSHPDGEPDYSWFAVIPFVTLVMGVGAGLLAVLVFVFLVAPVTVIVLRSPAAVRGDLAARHAVLISLFVLLLLLFAGAMTLVDPDDGRPRLSGLVGLLLGLIDVAPGRGPAIWAARAMVLAMLGLPLLIIRVRREMKALGLDPDAGVPDPDAQLR